jgi:hypothetical protein
MTDELPIDDQPPAELDPLALAHGETAALTEDDDEDR